MKKFLFGIVVYIISFIVGVLSIIWLSSNDFRSLISLLVISFLDVKFFKLFFNFRKVELFNIDKIEKLITVIKFIYFTMTFYGIFINLFFSDLVTYYKGLLKFNLEIDTNPWLFIFAVLGPILAGFSIICFMSVLAKSYSSEDSIISSIFQYSYDSTSSKDLIEQFTIKRICSTEALNTISQFYEQIRINHYVPVWHDKDIRIFQIDSSHFYVEIEHEFVSIDFEKVKSNGHFLVKFEKKKLQKIQVLRNFSNM
ncbi:TPA: hypothetical protein U0431_001151 [Streptococcus suis]|nr:hypothetical protein [Streptococcus suis]